MTKVLKRAKRDKATSLKTAYIDPKKFYQEMAEWVRQVRANEAEGKPKPRMNDYIGKCFVLIATNLASKGNFAGYTFREEMVGDAIINCVKYAGNFDPDRSTNPFSYFTQIAYNTFLSRLKTEEVQRYIKARISIETSMLDISMDEYGDEGDGPTMQIAVDALTDSQSDFIKRFEEKNKVKGKKKKQTAGVMDTLFN